MAPTVGMLEVHVGLKKDRRLHMSLQERSLRPTLKSTGEIFGVHMEFTRAILWFMWVLQEKCLCSRLMTTDGISPIRRIRKTSYLTNNQGRKSAQVQSQKPIFVSVYCTFRARMNRREQCFCSDNHLNKLLFNKYLLITY